MKDKDRYRVDPATEADKSCRNGRECRAASNQSTPDKEEIGPAKSAVSAGDGLMATGGRSDLECLLSEQTAQLQLANHKLQLEIDERKRVEEALRRSQQMLQLVMDNIPQAIFWKDTDSVYLGCNANFAAHAGVASAEAIIGKTDYEMPWRKEEADFFRACDRRVMATNATESHIIEPQFRPDGKQAWLDTNKLPLHDADGNVVGVLGTYEDITERKFIGELLLGERKILEMVATGRPLQDTLDALTGMVEQMAEETLSCLLLVDNEDRKLYHVSAPSLPQDYVRAIEGLVIGPAAGSCGSAVSWGETVLVADLATDPRWSQYRDVVQQFGLTACWSVPIHDSNGQVLGTFALYSRVPRCPSKHEQQLVETAAHLAGIAIQRNRFQAALQESEAKYRTLFEESRDAIYIISRKGRFVDANQAGVELFGYSREELLKRVSVVDLHIDPNDRQKFREVIERRGSVRNYPAKLRKKNGEMMDCLITSTVKRDQEGTILGYQGIIRDITRRKRAERELQESEARYRAIVEDQTELICRFQQDGTLSFVNQAVCRYFGKSRQELLGRDFMPLIPAEDRPGVRQHLAALSRENPVGTHVHRVFAADGTIRWQQWTHRLICDETGRVIEIQGVGSDITEKCLMEEALRESAEKIKLFAYSISHDLKTPIISVYGLTRLLHSHSHAALNERGRHICEQILKAARQAAELVEKINTYISTKETGLNIEEVELAEVVDMVREEFEERLRERRIRWSQSEMLPSIRADRLSLSRLLRNLIDNALKYGGNPLTQIAVVYNRTEKFHCVSVTDDGAGIEQMDYEKIFDLFERRQASRAIEGAGLGLAIVKEIAAQHGGRVYVESEPGIRTVFHVSIARTL